MSLENTINNDIKAAMLSKEKELLEALRAVKAAILIEKTSKSTGEGEITEEAEIKILQKLVKQRKESAEVYSDQNRPDLAKTEIFQASVIEKYLPEQINEDELVKIVKKIIESVNATSIKDMGKVMGEASKHLAGKADNKSIAEIVKKLLAG